MKWLGLSVNQQCYFNIGVGFWYLFTNIRQSIVKILERVNAKQSATNSISRSLPGELKGNWRVLTGVARVSDDKLLNAGPWLNVTHKLHPVSIRGTCRYITVQLHDRKLLVDRVCYWMICQGLIYKRNGHKLSGLPL